MRNEVVVRELVGIKGGFGKGRDIEYVCGLVEMILWRVWEINNVGGKEEKLEEKFFWEGERRGNVKY